MDRWVEGFILQQGTDILPNSQASYVMRIKFQKDFRSTGLCFKEKNVYLDCRLDPRLS